jgi:hypothetical protein
MEGIIDLHHDIFFFLIWVVILVAFILFEFVIGSFKLKELSSVFNPTFMINLNKVSSDQLHISKVLPTNIQHNTVLEII